MLGYEQSNYEYNSRERNRFQRLSQKEREERLRHLKAREEQRARYDKEISDAFSKRIAATTSKVITVILEQGTTNVKIAELLDKGYEVTAMNDNCVLLVTKGTTSNILKG